MEVELLKKLISYEELDSTKIEEYIKTVSENDRGLYNYFKDSVNKAIAAAFELVIEHDLNPWSINIIEFTKLYFEKLKDEQFMDFITAGELILRAWQILEKKSDILLQKYKDTKNEIFQEMWDPYAYDMPFENYDLTDSLTNAELIREPVRREEKRPVTFIELINALETTMKEQRLRKENNEKKFKLNEALRQNWDKKLHKDSIKEEMIDVWNRIVAIEKDHIELSELHNNTKPEFIKVFVSSLYLHKERKINLVQNGSYQSISMNVLVPEQQRKIEFLTPPKVEVVTEI